MAELTQITLTIDGRTVPAQAGDTVLDAARRANIHIPTLCAHEDLSPFGACRLCIVEIEGVRGYPTSCTTPAAAGMVVRTQSPELEELRNVTLELTLSGHPNSCLVCDHRSECDKVSPAGPHPTKAGQSTRCGTCSNCSDCTLRDMDMALTGPARALNLPTLYSHYKVERGEPFIERNHNMCVLCGRCWRICEELHGTPAISIVHRGRAARIGTAFDRPWVESGCTFCGACVDICPTGTLTDRFGRWYPSARREVTSTCMLCPQACSMELVISENRVVATRMTRFRSSERLCAAGRFGYAQVLASTSRLLQPMIREDGDLTPVPWEEAISTVAAQLQEYRGKFVIITGEPQTWETRWIYEQLALNVSQGRVVTVHAGSGRDQLPATIREDLASGRIEALWVTGDFVPEELLEKVKYLVVADFLPSPLTARANAVLPAAVLAEVDGNVRSAAGELKGLAAPVSAPGEARPEWNIVYDLAKAMGIESFADPQIPRPVADDGITPQPIAGDPRARVADLPARFRGHLLADLVPALQALGLPASSSTAEPEQLVGFRVVAREEIIPNFHKLVIEAPTIARRAKPGQFAIVMVGQRSERVPFTLVDWDEKAGTITFIIEEVGRSSQEIVRLQAGQLVAHVSGPLGLPLPITAGGTVVLGGGCYGVGAIYPIARAFKQAGNRVIAAIEGCSAHMIYMEREMREVCDRVYIATKDGSRGRKGGVQELFLDLQKTGLKIDQYVAVGCTFMMRQVAQKTADSGIPLQVALNPIMVDGTGMCGACRVEIGSETKFACVDGPFFDGRAVHWDQLVSRRQGYLVSEVEAIPQTAGSHVLPILEESRNSGAR